MASSITTKAPPDVPEQIARISSLLRNVSLETARPDRDDLTALSQSLPPATLIYLPVIPTRSAEEVITAAVQVRAAGFEPVPHIAARNFQTVAALEDFLFQLTAKANVSHVLLIRGDHSDRSRPFQNSFDVLKSELLTKYGVQNVGIAGYPDGHPVIPHWEIRRALETKIKIVEQQGHKLNIVTQFCFDAEVITRWIEKVRNLGFDHTIRVGLVGPTNLMTLLRYMRRCGVQASAQGLIRQSHLARQMFQMIAPNAIVRALAEDNVRDELGNLQLHFFTFGGVGATSRWIAAILAGHLALTCDEGFQILK
jgi:methylenetetrahydrofolate reductase (NADPH)